MTKDAERLMPDLQEEDFYKLQGGVYETLYNKKQSNEALFNVCLSIAQKTAREFRVPNFMKTWYAYLAMRSPKDANVLGNNQTMFPEQPLQLSCGKYDCEDHVSYYDPIRGDVEVISHPILITKRIINIDSGDEMVQIAFNRGKEKEYRYLISSADTISSAQRIIGLARKGIAVTSENAKEVVKFLSSLVSLNYNELVVQKSTTHLGWLPNGEFAPYAEDIEYDSESPENQRMYNAFTTKGTYEKWLEVAKGARAGKSVPARMALAGAFAAPLVSKFGGLPFILHFFGASGKGKSVGLMLSASVWAEPTVGGAYIRTFGATKVAQELTAAFCCNVPMYLDELQIISDRKMFDDIIYMLCEGSSKPRGAKDGGLQLAKQWSNCILTTGEMPIIQSNSGGGAAARVIEIDYDVIPLFEDARTVANTLKANYGFAGKMFIDELCKEGALDELRDVQSKFYAELSNKDIHAKQVLSASILLAADYFAGKVLFHDGNDLTVDDVLPYLITNQQVDSSARAFKYLMGIIEANPQHFTKSNDSTQEVWGFKEDGYVYFNKTMLEKLFAKDGFPLRPFLTWAKQNGKIKGEDHGKGSGNNRNTIRRTGINENGEKKMMLYVAIKDSIEEEQPQQQSQFVEVDDEELPF